MNTALSPYRGRQRKSIFAGMKTTTQDSGRGSGRVVRVLPGFHARGASLYVVYPSTKQVPLRVNAFRDFVTEAFAAWSTRQQNG